jgi:hypothetical protein
MTRLTVRALAAVIVALVLLAGVALLGRPAPAAKATAWADVCAYPMNRPPGICVNLPNRLPLL